MRDHYDFTRMKGRPNPFIRRLTQPVTMQLDADTIAWFKSLAQEMDIPYERVIDAYLRDCAVHRRRLPVE